MTGNIHKTIRVKDETIEALDNGKVAVNGNTVTTVEELERTVNILIRSVITLAHHTDAQ